MITVRSCSTTYNEIETNSKQKAMHFRPRYSLGHRVRKCHSVGLEDSQLEAWRFVFDFLDFRDYQNPPRAFNKALMVLNSGCLRSIRGQLGGLGRGLDLRA